MEAEVNQIPSFVFFFGLFFRVIPLKYLVADRKKRKTFVQISGCRTGVSSPRAICGPKTIFGGVNMIFCWCSVWYKWQFFSGELMN